MNTALYLRCWIETLLCGPVGHSLNKNVLCDVVLLVDGIINVFTIVTVAELKILASLLYAHVQAR